jgi:hypothetical protein
MSGFTRATLLFSPMAFIAFFLVSRINLPLCVLPLSGVFGVVVGYIGAQWKQDDAAKTARIARSGGKAGLIVGVCAALGSLAQLLLSSYYLDIVPACTGVLIVALFAFFGWVGGWSWARHEHERQTGYKPT